MSFKEIILKKRDGREHSAAELESLVRGIATGRCAPEQAAAWLMAAFLNHLSPAETSWLTQAMWKTGQSFPRTGGPRFWVDKHSTCGVGDKTSLLLVPIVAAACRELFGEKVVGIPMISGRGLGITGGTLDKLESVPGFQTNLSSEMALSLLEQQGFFMMGQTAEIAPADRVLYALRDLTSTVDYEPFIISSIMSKKLSESLDGLVIDVKYGRGAMMPTKERARALAKNLVWVAREAGVRALAFLTPMDEPLGWTAGNALEVEECAQFFNPAEREPGLEALVFELAAGMVWLAGRDTVTWQKALEQCRQVAANGIAKLLFIQMFVSQQGDYLAFERSREEAKRGLKSWVFDSPKAGFVKKMDALILAGWIVQLGGGVPERGNAMDREVGIIMRKKVGDRVEQGEPLFEVRCRDLAQTFEFEKDRHQVVEISSQAMPVNSDGYECVR